MKTKGAEDELREWGERERANGLVDLKFFPGSSSDTLVRDAAEEVCKAAAETLDCEDVTNQRV